MKKIIAITGGIGSGKSVLSRILAVMGYDVYDCDAEAKKLMNDSVEIKESINEVFQQDIVVDGHIDKEKLSKIVFSNKEMLFKLNNIVHPIVRNHFKGWVDNNDSKIMFVETAILHESKLIQMIDEIWLVIAPEEIRIKRVMKRNSIDEHSVKMRINSQNCNDLEDDAKTKVIINDGIMPLIPQLTRLLENVK